MDLEIIGALVAVIGSLLAIIKMALKEYFKQANLHESKRHQNVNNEIEKLKETLDQFDSRLDSFTNEFKKLTEKTNHLQTNVSTFYDMTKKFYELQNDKYVKIESLVIAVSKELIILKGVVNGKSKQNQ